MQEKYKSDYSGVNTY